MSNYYPERDGTAITSILKINKLETILNQKSASHGAGKIDYLLPDLLDLKMVKSTEIDKTNFLSYFNRDFWKAFTYNRAFPIDIPQNKKEKNQLLELLFEEITSGCYSPYSPEVELIIDKGYGVARIVPVFSIRDYCVYYFCIKELENILCGNRIPNTFGGWSLGGKLRKQEEYDIENNTTDYGRYSFNPKAWSKAFGEFNSLLFSQIDTENYNYVLQFDIANFYDCIRLDILERWIEKDLSGSKKEIVTLLFKLLNYWNRKNTDNYPQVVGLPQDALADCSRILANYYLQIYDSFAYETCNKFDGEYFRYSDDQMILLNSKDKANHLLLLLTKNLARYGLRVNQKKVRLWTTQDLMKHRCRHIQAIFREEHDNKNPLLVKKFVTAYLTLNRDELENSWNNGIPLLNRLIWSNLESLPHYLFKKILVRLTDKKFLSNATSKLFERIRTLNNRRISPINFDKRIEEIALKTVHNIFHYEALKFSKAIKNISLQKTLEERIEQLNFIIEQNINE